MYTFLSVLRSGIVWSEVMNIFSFNRYSQVVFHTVLPLTLPSAMHENFSGSQPAKIQYVCYTFLILAILVVISHMDLHFSDDC